MIEGLMADQERATRLRERVAAEIARRHAGRKLSWFRPYPKQQLFFAEGSRYRERLLRAGNGAGKTECGAYELACHLTGEYPLGWLGRTWDHGIEAWAGGPSNEMVREGIQAKLLGPTLSQAGVGMIPRDSIIRITRAPGTPGLAATIQVRHKSGGISNLSLKSYEQGREKWQAARVHYVWFDEEPPEDIYSEGLSRTNGMNGCVALTFTPLLGMSSVVLRFLQERHVDRGDVVMTLADSPHITDAERARIEGSYAEHERDARIRGIPALGSGRVFPLRRERIAVPREDVPIYWRRIGGMDFGWDHPTAAVGLGYDADNDIVYVTRAYRQRQVPLSQHAEVLARWEMPIAWPHDGMNERTGGDQMAVQYRNAGVRMLGERATFADGGNAVEPGVAEILERMESGRFFVFEDLSDWFEEFQLYHRKDGKIVKKMDDLMDATRYAMMMLRHARSGIELRNAGSAIRQPPRPPGMQRRR